MRSAIETAREIGRPLTGAPRDYDPLMDLIGDVRFALLGEASHGTHEFYRPETERVSHYFYARLPKQFDAVLHFDETRAVEPLERTAEWDKGEPPETYPFGV
jgi:erythromycin esterase-like protein